MIRTSFSSSSRVQRFAALLWIGIPSHGGSLVSASPARVLLASAVCWLLPPWVVVGGGLRCASLAGGGVGGVLASGLCATSFVDIVSSSANRFGGRLILVLRLVIGSLFTSVSFGSSLWGSPTRLGAVCGHCVACTGVVWEGWRGAVSWPYRWVGLLILVPRRSCAPGSGFSSFVCSVGLSLRGVAGE